MTRLMYDSVTAADIPRTALMVAGYVDGAYAWTAGDWAYHGAAVHVRITVTGNTLDAHVADVENGDLTPAQGAAWLARKKAAGQLGCLYFSQGNWPAVAAAAKAAGLGPNDWTQWPASWTGAVPSLANNYAIQYDHPPHSGGHYDLSAVRDYWPGIDPAPAPPPVVVPPPVVAPPPVSGGGTANPTNDARAAMAILAEALGRGFAALTAALDAAVAQLKSG